MECGIQFTERTQSIHELGVGGEEDIVGSAVPDLLRKESAGLGYETNPDYRTNSDWVRFFKLLREVGFEVGEVGGSGDGECGLRNRDG